jgi:hypothetical protein
MVWEFDREKRRFTLSVQVRASCTIVGVGPDKFMTRLKDGLAFFLAAVDFYKVCRVETLTAPLAC